MKRSRLTDEQIIGILKGAEAGTLVSELCRNHDDSDASVYMYGLFPFASLMLKRFDASNSHACSQGEARY